MKKIKNKPYESPQLTAVSFKVEAGFTASAGMRSLFTFQKPNDEYEATTFGRSGYGNAAENGNQQSWF